MSESTDYPRSWYFKNDNGEADGPVFEGRFTGVISMGTTAYGDKPVARFIEEKTGEEVSIWLNTSILQDQVAKLDLATGELVRIEYLGKKKSKSSTRSYQSYRATAPERPVENLSWASLAAVEDEDDDNE